MLIKMAPLDPGTMRDLTEARADLARHGVVIIRAIEMDLEPAVMSEIKSSMASSPGKMEKLEDADLDDLVEKLRKTTKKSIEQLRELYVRLLAKLGNQPLADLVKELDGIEQLFKWQRIAQTLDPVNLKLTAEGFRPISMASPDLVSDSLAVELEHKWPAAYDRFKALAMEAASQLARAEQEAPARPRQAKAKKASRKG